MYRLSSEQREAIADYGTPLPITDDETGEAYMLLGIEFQTDPESGSVVARVPGIRAYGEGDSEEEAMLALSAALNSYIEAFGDRGKPAGSRGNREPVVLCPVPPGFLDRAKKWPPVHAQGACLRGVGLDSKRRPFAVLVLFAFDVGEAFGLVLLPRQGSGQQELACFFQGEDKTTEVRGTVGNGVFPFPRLGILVAARGDGHGPVMCSTT